jgi:hypothetical protein
MAVLHLETLNAVNFSRTCKPIFIFSISIVLLVIIDVNFYKTAESNFVKKIVISSGISLS